MKLTEEERNAIREEFLRLGSLNGAIKFCLGYKGLLMTPEMQRTFEEVKKQL